MLGSAWDWIIVIVVALVLFGGASKLPEIFRSLGRAVGEFRKGQIEVENELRQMQSAPAAQPQQSAQQNNSQAKGEAKPDDAQSVDELKKKVEELQRQVEELKKGK